MVKWIRSFDRMMLAEEIEIRGEKTVPLPICTPQIPDELAWIVPDYTLWEAGIHPAEEWHRYVHLVFDNDQWDCHRNIVWRESV